MRSKYVGTGWLRGALLFGLICTATLPAFAAEDAVIVRDIQVGTGNSSPADLILFNDYIYFSAASSGTNRELWRAQNLSAANTNLVNEIRAGGTGSNPANFAAAPTFLFFTADNGSTGAEPFFNNGTATHAQLLLDIRPGGTGSSVGNVTVVGNNVFFTANDNSTGVELYVTNGTPAGTLRPRDIRTGGGNSSNPSLLTALGNLVIFEATNAATNIEPWVSDGTLAGTIQLANISATGSSDPTSMRAVPELGYVFFDANAGGTIGRELYRTDGTAAGTVLVSDIRSGSNSSSPTNLSRALGLLFFSADSGGNGIEPYVSNGTGAGTVQLANISAGGGDSNPYGFTEAGGIVYFGADGPDGVELYRTDGTPGGTSLVENIRSGTNDSSPNSFTAFGNLMFFTANDGGGVEPWISDGTAGGTFELADINPGSGSSTPQNIVVTSDFVYFTADDNGATGREWWRTDGTAAGTVLVHDVRSGPNDANVTSAATRSTFVFFSASNGTGGGQFGQELWGIEYTMPTVLSINRASTNPTNAAQVSFTVTFSEPVTGVSAADFDITTTGTLTGTSIASVTPVSSQIYTVVVNTGTGAGTLRLDVDDDDTIQDQQGSANPLGGTGSGNGDFTTGQVFDIDRQAPSVSSIILSDPNPTTAPSVNFNVTFSEDVNNVDATDFSLTLVGIIGATITNVVEDAPGNYTVTASTGTGGGTIRLNVVDNDSIVDNFANPLGGTGAGNGNYTAGPSYNIDLVPPAVQSIVRASANPSGAASVDFTVTFNEAVTGVNAADFALTAGGVTGATVGSVTPVSTSVYTVSVNTGAGSGTLRLDVIDDGSIVDLVGNQLGGAGAGNGNFTAGESYTLDKVFPVVQSIVRAAANPTNAASVTFTVTFSENVSGVNNGDFALFVSGVTGSSITSTAQVNPSVYTVTVNTGSNSGTIRLDLNDNDSIQDAVGNRLGGTGNANGNFASGETYTIDKTGPVVLSIVRAAASPTNAASIPFTVTFSENVTGVNGPDFSLTTTGVTGTSIGTITQVTPDVYTVNVNTGSNSGTIRLNFVDNNSVTDALGNQTTANFNAGEVYTIDRTGPTVSSINRVDTDPTSAAVVNFLVTFNEDVTGVDTADFTLTQGGGVSGATVGTVTQNTPSTYNVAVNTGTGAGTLRLNFADNDSVVDSFGNVAGGAGAGNANFNSGQLYTIDRTAPAVSSINRSNPTPTASATVNYLVIFNENVTGVNSADFTLNVTGLTGASVVSVTPVSGTDYTVTVNTGSGSGTLRLDLADDDSIADTAGNLLGGAGAGNGNFTTGQVYTVDRQAPTVVSIVREDANPTNAADVDFIVTFSENVTGVGTGDFSLTTTGVTGTSISASTQLTPSTYRIRVDAGSGSGTIRLNLIDNDSIEDSLGNNLGGTGNGNGNFTTGEVYTIDRTAPAVQSIVRAAASPTAAASVPFTVTFNEDVTGVNNGDFTLTTTGVAGTSITSTAQITPSTYTVNVNTGTGSGTIRLNFVDNNSVVDLAGNQTTANFNSGEVYTIDRNPPVVDSINRFGNSNPNADASVTYRVAFSKVVTGVDVTDFTTTATGGITGASVTGVVDEGAGEFTVTVNSGSGSGTLRLNFVDNDSVIDGSSIPVGGAGAGNGNFNSGQTYDMDRTGPSVNSITRISGNPTNNASVSYFVTFDESVSGFTAGDLEITTTGSLTGTSVGSVTQIIFATLYVVTVNTGTGSGTLRLDFADDDTVTDLLGNPMGGVGADNGDFTSGEVYTVDRDTPSVLSVVPAGANPTNAASASFTVTFTESVTGVNSGDFLLTTTGVAGASITSTAQVTPSTYTVTVNTGTGSGTIRLDVDDNDSIRDLANNRLGGTGNDNGDYNAGTPLTVDRVAPTVQSINRAGSNPTGLASIAFTVVFSEDVTGVNNGDFALDTTGVTGASVASVNQVNPSTYSVNVNTGTGSGTIRLNLSDNDSIVDLATNQLGGAGAGNGNFTGQQYTIDKSLPAVSAITRSDANPTAAASVNFGVTFTEDVTGVDAADFALTATGGVTGASVSGVVQNTGSTYTVTISTGSGDGTLRLDFADDDSVVDSAGNPAGGAGAANGNFTTGQSYNIDRTAPAVLSIVRADGNPTAATSVNFTVTFTEDVSGVGPNDFTLTTTGLTGATIDSRTQITPSTYTITVLTGTGSGTMRLDLADNDSIVDALGNQLGGAGAGNGNFTAGEARTNPAVLSIIRDSASPTNAPTVQYTVTFSENVTGVNVGDFDLVTSGVTGASIISRTQITPATYTVLVNTGTGDGTVRLDLDDNDSIRDAVNNPLGGAGNDNGDFAGEVYTLDRTVPVINTLTRVTANPTAGTTVDWDATFSEAVSGVDVSDFTIATTGLSGASVVSVAQNAPNVYRVTVNTGTGNGTVRLSLADDDSITDTATNPLGGAGAGNGNFTGQQYTVQKNVPAVSSITRADANPTNAAIVDFTVVFSMSVSGVDAMDFTLNTSGVSGASIVGVTIDSPSQATVAVSTGSGSGTIRLDLVDNDSIVDVTSNPLGGVGANNGNFTTGEVYNVDKTSPAVASLTRTTANPTNGSSVSFDLEFTKDVTGVGADDVSVQAAGLTGAGIVSITQTGPRNFLIIVNTGTGEGTLTVAVLDDDSIVDGLGVPLGGVGAGNGNFSSGESFTVDRTLPVVTIGNPSTNSTVNGPVELSVLFTGADTILLNAGMVQLNTTGTATGSVSVSGSSPSGRIVTISSITGEGTLSISIDAGAASDAATNLSAAAGPSAVVDVTLTPSVPVNPWLLVGAMLMAVMALVWRGRKRAA